MKTTSFKPAGDANGVLVSIPEADAMVYVEDGFSTDDPLVVAALDTNPAVVRASAGDKPADAPAPAATSTEKES